MFAATAAPTGSGRSAGVGHVATTTLLPSTVSMRTADEVPAALRVLRPPEDTLDRCMDLGREFVPSPDLPDAGPTRHNISAPDAARRAADRAKEWSREMSPAPHLGETELVIQSQELPDGTTSDFEGLDADCPQDHSPTELMSLLDGSLNAYSADLACSLGRTRSRASLELLDRERERDVHLDRERDRDVHLDRECERDVHHVRMHAGPPAARGPTEAGDRGVSLMPPPRLPGKDAAAARPSRRMHAAQDRLKLHTCTMEACEAALAELLADPHQPQKLAHDPEQVRMRH